MCTHKFLSNRYDCDKTFTFEHLKRKENVQKNKKKPTLIFQLSILLPLIILSVLRCSYLIVISNI